MRSLPQITAAEDGARPICLSLRVTEACRALGIGRTSLYRMISSGEIKTAVIAGRRVIPVSELSRILEESIDDVGDAK